MAEEEGTKTSYQGTSMSEGEQPRRGSVPAAMEATMAEAAPSEELRVGSVLDDRYVIEAQLGEGGMGIVYRGRHRVIDKRVAIKVLRRNLSRSSEMSERFLNEARSASRVGSPHIVDISDFGRVPDGGAYFVMEYLDGISLAQALRNERMPAARIIHIGKQLARGLAAAHAMGIVHRDLKPDNVMLVTRGADRDVVKILDFGIAKVGGDSQRLTRTGSVFGTPHYMSPEQAAGVVVDRLSDVYALGVIFYEMTCGRVPFDADSFMAILTQHMYKAPLPFRELPMPPPDILPGFEQLVLKCLAKKPADRYESMDELLAELERVERGELSRAATSGVDPSTYAVPADYYGDASLAIPAAPATREGGQVRDSLASAPARVETAPPRASASPSPDDEPSIPGVDRGKRNVALALGAVAVVALGVAFMLLRPSGEPSSSGASLREEPTSVHKAGAPAAAPQPAAPEAPASVAASPTTAPAAPPVLSAKSSRPEPTPPTQDAPRPEPSAPAKPSRVQTKPAAKATKPAPASPAPAAAPARPQARPPTCAIEDWDPFEHKCAR